MGDDLHAASLATGGDDQNGSHEDGASVGSGEGKVLRLPDGESACFDKKDEAEEPTLDERTKQVLDMEKKISTLKTELAVACRQLQVVKGDPKTPIWLELPDESHLQD